MQLRETVVFYSPKQRPSTEPLRGWLNGHAYSILHLRDRGSLETAIRRKLPVLVVIDAEATGAETAAVCRSLKSDPYTAIVPVVLIAWCHAAGQVREWFQAGADEVITPIFEPAEQRSRLEALLERTQRTVGVHPSTRLPGTNEIEREIRRRLDRGDRFAVCYADIDHFKEFNDRYSYYDGDRVIYIVSRILRDVVKGLSSSAGFVGHIGGDDFIFVVPLADVESVCREIIWVFDTIMPLQYSHQDRRAGYFFGTDRRGQLHRVPLMTLSIGIVTNEHQLFEHPAQLSELATEMKNYAKTLPGSVFVFNRRRAPAAADGSGGAEGTARREARG